MPVSPFEPDADPRSSGASEPWGDPVDGPEMRASSREEPEDLRAAETPEEPGYGHGV